MPTMIGANILVSRDGTALYGSPSGTQIGIVKKGTTGKIIDGPIIMDGVKYWHIKLDDDGREGWVAEDNLEYIVQQGLAPKLTVLFLKVFLIFKLVALLFSIILVGCVVYLYKKVVELRKNEAKVIYTEKVEQGGTDNPQWERVLNHIGSTSESDWRLAVLEADIILDTLLDNMRLPGETMADKLKAVEKSDFTTIDSAWEAHKIRNQIAHESDYVLNQHEAKRVVGLYQSVFEEFRII
jgi:hypothetical protein